jgi:hypothetical protein
VTGRTASVTSCSWPTRCRLTALILVGGVFADRLARARVMVATNLVRVATGRDAGK